MAYDMYTVRTEGKIPISGAVWPFKLSWVTENFTKKRVESDAVSFLQELWFTDRSLVRSRSGIFLDGCAGG